MSSSEAVPVEGSEAPARTAERAVASVGARRARPAAGWTATVDGSTATWQGGPLAHLAIETFRLELDVSSNPGLATLDTVQLYPSGATVKRPATLTVVPGARRRAVAGCRVGIDRRDRRPRADRLRRSCGPRPTPIAKPYTHPLLGSPS